MTDGLSDYEKQRLANIAANRRVLESLGLGGGGRVTGKPAQRRPGEAREGAGLTGGQWRVHARPMLRSIINPGTGLVQGHCSAKR